MNEIIREIKQIPIEKLANDLLLDLDNNYAGNCPTGHPSKSGKCFKLNIEENLYHCFNCGIGGDVISLHQLVTGDDFRITIAELSRIYLGHEVSYNSRKYTRGKKYFDNNINYELNKCLNQMYFLKLEKAYLQLRCEAEIQNLTFKKQRLDDLLKIGKIELAIYYTKLELLYEDMDEGFAQIDKKFTTESYRIKQGLKELRKMKNEQFKNGLTTPGRKRIRKGDQAENLIF